MERIIESRVRRVQRKRWRKRFIRIFLFFLLIAIGVGTFAGSQIFGSVMQGYDTLIGKSELREKPVQPKTEPFTVLIIGGSDTDSADKNGWLPDAILFAAINPQTNSMKLISIPRDTYVTIANTDGYKDKINSAAMWGRIKGVGDIKNLIQTVENFLDVPVDYYVKINFKGFIDVVDIMDGVDVNVPFSFNTSGFTKNVHASKTFIFQKGPQHLNGEEALAYVRMRKKDPAGDHGRNVRQQQVLSQLLDKMVHFEGITKFTEIIKAVGENVSYNFEPSNFLILQSTYNKVKGNTQIMKLTTVSEKKKHLFDGKYKDIWFEICLPAEQKRVSQALQHQISYTPKPPE
jgi:polyisoprenyl-teichoic acid--peptidoglycan teichoic acid transferase